MGSKYSCFRGDSNNSNGQSKKLPSDPSISFIHILYAHALENIFSFATFKDAATLMHVCTNWQEIILHMRPLKLSIQPMMFPHQGECLSLLCASRLRRHVSSISTAFVRPSIKILNEIAALIPHLEDITIQRTPINAQIPLIFPVHLRRLQLIFLALDALDVDYDPRVMENISQLHELENFALSLPHQQAAQFSIASLANVPSLRSITASNVTPRLIDELREFSHLEWFLTGDPEIPWRQLFAPGHKLYNLKTLERADITFQSDLDALANVPSLTSLPNIYVPDACLPTHVDFLRQLAKLNTLCLNIKNPSNMDTQRMLDTLSQCTLLTSLDLLAGSEGGFHFNSIQLTNLLPRLPLLQRLLLINVGQLTSLSFLSSGPITSTLTDLTVEFFPESLGLDVNELSHLHHLHSLNELTLQEVFNQTVTENQIALYRPPSELIPSLVKFNYNVDESEMDYTIEK
jgi:hypothetical protein